MSVVGYDDVPMSGIKKGRAPGQVMEIEGPLMIRRSARQVRGLAT